MSRLVRSHATETGLIVVIAAMALALSLGSERFATLGNLFDLLNVSAVNVIFAVGLLVVLVAGGIDISFAVAASVAQYLTALALAQVGGGGWALGALLAGGVGVALGCVNAALIHHFRIISIVVTIATFNAFFGLLMFFTQGRSIYDLPAWWTERIILVEREAADGSWAELRLPALVMVLCALATWALLRRTSWGRQLFAFGDNPEGARRAGVNVAAMHYLAYGWLGAMAGIAGLMQVNYAREIVPNALYGRELEVLAAVVLGGARLGGGRGTVLGCLLGVWLIAMTQNGLNLLGVSPYAFQMIVGAIILVAISTSHGELRDWIGGLLRGRGAAR